MRRVEEAPQSINTLQLSSVAALVVEYERGRNLFRRGDTSRGAAALEEFLQQADTFLSQPRHVRGRIREIRGAHEAAMLLWQHYEAAGHLDEAVRFARVAVTKHRRGQFCGNDDSSAHRALQFADLLRRAGQLDEARAVCQPLLSYTSLNLKNPVPSLALELTVRIELQQFSESLEWPVP